MTTNNVAFKTKEISANSRVSISITRKGQTSYYTFEASETRSVDYEALPKNLEEAEQYIQNEWKALYDTVNEKVDEQINEVISLANSK